MFKGNLRRRATNCAASRLPLMIPYENSQRGELAEFILVLKEPLIK